MKLGHIIYTVRDLDAAVKEWQGKGFTVEYGRKENPINALIYFSEGPYIELMQGSGMSSFAKGIMKLFGKKKFMERFDYWDACAEGWSCLAIEKEPGGLEQEIAYLTSMGINGTYMKNLSRIDTQGRKLEYKCYFTDDVAMPFLMSYFTIDPKPKNYVHPNGIRRVDRVVYKVSQRYKEALEHLVDDKTLVLEEADGFEVIRVDFA